MSYCTAQISFDKYDKLPQSCHVLGYSLVAERAECLNTEYYEIVNSLYSIDECANACEEPATMFTFGTKDFDYDSVGNEGSCSKYGCKCLCWYGIDATTTCPLKDHNGYRLYKYNLVSNGNSFITVVLRRYRTYVLYFYTFTWIHSNLIIIHFSRQNQKLWVAFSNDVPT